MEKPLLTHTSPNDQKMFYGLFLKYRNSQLENYVPDGIGYSSSDYHHIKPQALRKTYSTCHFPSEISGHSRQASRFTVISNGAGTEHSYDPFKASRPQHLDRMQSNRLKVTIYPNSNNSMPRQVSRASTSMSRGLAPPRVIASRSSLASSTRSRTSGYRAPSYKRGVSFTHLRSHRSFDRKDSQSTLIDQPNRHSSYTEVTDNGEEFLRPVAVPASTRYIRSRKAKAVVSQPLLPPAKTTHTSQIWNEDVRQHSTSLAEDCDKAFNRTIIAKAVVTEKRASTGDWAPVKQSGLKEKTSRDQTVKPESSRTRPLPVPPARSSSNRNDLVEAKKQADALKTTDVGSPRYLDRVANRLDRLTQTISPPESTAERRTLSAPIEKRITSSTRPLPSILEAKEKDSSPAKASGYDSRIEIKNSRIASAPEPRSSSKVPRLRDTIRVVNASPVKSPEALSVRKKNSQAPGQSTLSGLRDEFGASTSKIRPAPNGLGLRQQYLADSAQPTPELESIQEDCVDGKYSESNTGTIVRKPSSWFKRNSRGSDEGSGMSIEGSRSRSGSGTVLQSHSSNSHTHRPLPEPELPEPHKKSRKLSSRIGKLFKKRVPKEEEMAVGGTSSVQYPSVLHRASYLTFVAAHDIFDDNVSVAESVRRNSGAPEDPRARQIEPQRSWLAKLFHVKPVTKYLCFSVSKRRARQEITTILKEWRRYGIKEVQVDKERNIVFGKVAAKNCKSFPRSLLLPR